MMKKHLYQDKNYLRDSQYKDSSNLDARATLHQLYSTTKIGWFDWVIEQVALTDGMRVLEVGGGPGWLWRNTLPQLPASCEILVTDFSPGMVDEARAALAHDTRFRFDVVNIEDIPLEDDLFDVVIGNHMLYHVPNLAKGLQEVRRVLKPNGRFLAATNGDNHMRELGEINKTLFSEIYARILQLYGGGRPRLSFALENGRSLLEPWFATVEKRLFDDSLVVTEAEPLINYLLSSQPAQEIATEEMIAEARRQLEAQIVKNGAIHIQKETGIFIAKP
ncbi:MAG: class I SAM-dependent methyltransferase [Chloroflexota bacterium]